MRIIEVLKAKVVIYRSLPAFSLDVLTEGAQGAASAAENGRNAIKGS